MNLLKTATILLISLLAISVGSVYLGNIPNLLDYELLAPVFKVFFAVVIVCFVLGEVTRNTSQVDKIWSITPIIYAWQIAYLYNWNAKLVLVSVLITVWGARLTYNFGRRGGYSLKFWSGEEDYRWAVLRSKPGFSNPIVWFVFDLFFICFYQNALLLLLVFPMLTLTASTIKPVDIILSIIFLLLIFTEYTADQQQFDFQTEKYRRINNKLPLKEYESGFIQTGLWKYSRHPNYACEQSVWVVIYLFSWAETGKMMNQTIVGAFLLIILFRSSSEMSESITVKKYSGYAKYQKTVGRFLPKLF
ncbi:Integral_membrane protein [Hexamita inflata]|uniref:Integral membrane protein n=1 Tax=Hexamita inflata TaxID=28002 RepID=A0AA86TUG2_9EUKA|nr:Integral membrane protein [Hexamita inflata]